MKNLYLRIGVLTAMMALAAVAYATPALLHDPGVTNGSVQTMAPINAYSRTYLNGTKSMKCYSTQAAGISNRIMVEFDARTVNTNTPMAGKFSMNRDSVNWSIKSTDIKSVDPSTTNFCFTPVSSATLVQSSWRGM